ncbi:insulin-like peptide INSL5 [Carassius auratus]|uniref:Insulin-like peptide INSL5 n=1 Tax=Carassius auratus TaxID=7957 RepID=A0A6P6PIT1_CARAU|nr:relaxin-3-like [Carassius auratus]XP_052415357.1 insulin-like 5a [Carassius gibelio]
MRGFHCPALLLLWAVCSVLDVQADDVRTVKLCGREFIRAIVYTCGSSRWRRLSSPQDMEGFFNGDLSSAEHLSKSLGSDLARRDLTDVCCQFGCKKSDLTLLC